MSSCLSEVRHHSGKDKSVNISNLHPVPAPLNTVQDEDHCCQERSWVWGCQQSADRNQNELWRKGLSKLKRTLGQLDPLEDSCMIPIMLLSENYSL